MSKMSFSQKLKEIVEATAKKTKGGKMKPTFSRRMYTKVNTALLNDPDYEMDTIQIKNGKPEKKPVKPSLEFREKFLGRILADAKMDKVDIAKMVKDYEFTESEVETLYDVNTAAMMEFMNAGKTFRFPSTKDFNANISIKNVKPSVYENKARGIKVKRAAHKSLVKKSSCPAWLKEKVK